MFLQVSVCPQGEPWANTPRADTHLGKQPPGTPPLADTPPPGRHPLPLDTVNKRAVRIPLECILVGNAFTSILPIFTVFLFISATC